MGNTETPDLPEPHALRRRPPFYKRLVSRMVWLLAFASIGLLAISMTSKPPANLGLHSGKLTECPATPNCVSSQTKSDEHRMGPIPFSGTIAEGTEKIKRTIAENFPRAQLIEQQGGYLRYEFSSLVFRFIDDVEFVVDDKEHQIHFRSASRAGHSDLGVNRRRMTNISQELNR